MTGSIVGCTEHSDNSWLGDVLSRVMELIAIMLHFMCSNNSF